MKKVRRLLNLLVLLLIPVLSWSQAKLTIDSIWTTPMDTIVYDNDDPIVEYNIIVRNAGNDKLDGACRMMTKYNQSAVEYNKTAWQATNFEVGQTTQITFKDTLFSLSTNRYKGGDNIIVIWPHTDNPSAQSPDTTEFGIFVDNLVAASDPIELQSRIVVWPNPTAGMLNIDYLENRNKIEHVRIVGIDGKILKDYTTAARTIDLDGFSRGIYLLQVEFKDGLRATYRISKTY